MTPPNALRVLLPIPPPGKNSCPTPAALTLLPSFVFPNIAFLIFPLAGGE